MKKIKFIIIAVVLILILATTVYATTDSLTGSHTVYVKSGGSISAALTAITDASETNRYTIKVSAGVYNETFKTKDYVDIIGESPHSTIIDYTGVTSEYTNESTIFATSTTKLENLTIRATNVKYAIHSDAGNKNTPYLLVIKNCIIEHMGVGAESTGIAGTPIGIGLYQNQHIEIMDSVLDGARKGSSGVYVHNQSSITGVGFRSLRVENSEIKDVSYGIRVGALAKTADQNNDVYLIGNRIQSLMAEIFVDSDQADNSWNFKANGNELNRIWQPRNTFIVEQVGFTKRVRNYGADMVRGSIATIWDTGAVGTINKEDFPLFAGVSLEDIPKGKEGVIQISGWIDSVKVTAEPVKNGSYLSTSKVHGEAKAGAANIFAVTRSDVSADGFVNAILLPLN